MERLIEINAQYWKRAYDDIHSGVVSSSGEYSPLDIIEENKTYSLPLLVELNKYVITTESQELMSQREDDTPLNNEFIEFVHDSRGFSIDSLRDNTIVHTTQIPYVELKTTVDHAGKIFNGLIDKRAMFMTYGEEYQYRNQKLLDAYERDKEIFPGSCFDNQTALTFHKTKHRVYNARRRVWDSTIVPTIFDENYYHNKRVYEKEWVYSDMAVMFIVGDLKTDTNSLFRDILNIFS